MAGLPRLPDIAELEVVAGALPRAARLALRLVSRRLRRAADTHWRGLHVSIFNPLESGVLSVFRGHSLEVRFPCVTSINITDVHSDAAHAALEARLAALPDNAWPAVVSFRCERLTRLRLRARLIVPGHEAMALLGAAVSGTLASLTLDPFQLPEAPEDAARVLGMLPFLFPLLTELDLAIHAPARRNQNDAGGEHAAAEALFALLRPLEAPPSPGRRLGSLTLRLLEDAGITEGCRARLAAACGRAARADPHTACTFGFGG